MHVAWVGPGSNRQAVMLFTADVVQSMSAPLTRPIPGTQVIIGLSIRCEHMHEYSV